MSCRIREAVSLGCMSSFSFGWLSVVLEAPSAIFRGVRGVGCYRISLAAEKEPRELQLTESRGLATVP